MQISAGSEKRAAFKAARELLEQDDESIIYVALELRRCLEAIVHEKLWVYRHRLPADSVHKWQPYQAFRALLLMEPDAGFTAMIGVSRQASPESTDRLPRLIGVDHRPKLQWLRATYHKLGSFLHARWPFEKRTVPTAPEDRREFLARLLLELEPFVGPTVTMALPVDVVAFECEFCQTTIQTARCALEELSEVECVGCDCRSTVERDGDDFRFHLDVLRAACSKCNEENLLPVQKVSLGFRFSCQRCGQVHSIVDHHWEFQPVGDPPPDDPTE